MSYTFGDEPSDVVTNSRGDVLEGVVLGLYPSKVDALASTNVLTSVTSDSSGRWTYTHATLCPVWVRTPSGSVYVANDPTAISPTATAADASALIAAEHTTERAYQSSTYVSHVAPPTGVSATDTAAITAAIAALPSSGGELRFPAGTYVTTGGFSLTVPVVVVGVGMAGLGNGEGQGSLAAGTEITCTSGTAYLFTTVDIPGRFKHIALRNTSVSAPTAGAGIRVTGTAANPSVSYDEVSVNGFYDNISSEIGQDWHMRGCRLIAPVRYGLRVLNTYSPDSGDWSISDTSFFSSVYASSAAIRVDSSGGGKISNCKINAGMSTHLFQHGIDISFASGTSTGDFNISNCSIENVSGDGIHIYAATGATLSNVTIAGTQISLLGTNTTGYPISIAGQSAYLIATVAITGCVVGGPGAVPGILLTNVSGAKIAASVSSGSTTALYSATGCQNVKCGDTPIVLAKAAQSGAVVFDLTAGRVQVCNMVGNVTGWTLTGTLTDGEEFEIWFQQDATGSRTLSAPGAGIVLASNNTLALTTTANHRDIIRFRSYGNTLWETGRSLNVGWTGE